MMAFCPEHPKWDQNLKFTSPKRDDKHPHPFHMHLDWLIVNTVGWLWNLSDSFVDVFVDLKVHNVQEHSYHFDRIDQ